MNSHNKPRDDGKASVFSESYHYMILLQIPKSCWSYDPQLSTQDSPIINVDHSRKYRFPKGDLVKQSCNNDYKS